MIFIILILGTGFLLVLDSTGNIDAFYGFLEDPVSGVLGLTNAPATIVRKLLAGPEDLQQAQAEIESLQLQLDAAQRRIEELQEVESEYQLLLDLFNRRREAPEQQGISATIIGQDTSPVFRSIIIDRGSDDGVLVGMPVESSQGLVGQVYRTTKHSAQVILITDNISSIPARLGTSRTTGLVRGGGLGGAMTLDWVQPEAQLQVGEVVLTSGLGGKFPQDMVIGHILEVDRQEADLFQQAVVQPAVDFDSLEVVFVITSFRVIDTSIFDDPPESVPTNP
ncbi:MAG: rod shape-determining protein MreC [Candidatus Promineifilaceae bacterium]